MMVKFDVCRIPRKKVLPSERHWSDTHIELAIIDSKSDERVKTIFPTKRQAKILAKNLLRVAQ